MKRDLPDPWKRLIQGIVMLSILMLWALPALSQTSTATVTTDKEDYAPGETAIITGTGWSPGEIVELDFEHIEPNIPDHEHDLYEVTADDNGNIFFEFYIGEEELGTTFHLMARGRTSGLYAETFFTDATWLLIGSYPDLCGGGPSELTFTIRQTNNASPRNSSFGITFPAGFTLNSPSITSVPSGKTWSIQIVGNRVWLYAFNNSNTHALANGDEIVFKLNAIPTNVLGSYTLSGFGNGNNSSIPTSGQSITPNSGLGSPSTLQVTKLLPTTSAPSNQNLVYGNNASFSVSASGTGTLAYVWEEFNGTWNPISNGGIYSGANTNTLTLTKPGVALSGRQYRVKVTGDCGSVTSNPAILTVTPAALTVSITASDKVYDATTAATVSAVNPAAGLIAGDDVTATASNGNFDNKNVGTGKTVTADIATSGADAGNYSFNATAADLADITQAAVTVSITADDKVYDATTAATVAVSGISGILLSDVVTATASNGNFDNKNVGTGKTVTADIATSGADAGNYSFNATSSTTADIMPAPLTITAQNASKYEGQANPAFTVTYDGFVGDETESVLGGTLMFTTAATVNSCAGNYDIIPSGFTPGNYAFTYVNGTLTVLGTSIDASASSTPVPVGQPATLRATVTPNVPGVSVTFVLTNDANVTVFSQTVLTNASGVATATTGNLGVLGVYEVTATVGSGCASSIAYIPVFDASGSFVTGGGWINSPAGALVADPTIVGKANFGFVSKYKKGSTQVDGNTEFQFQAGSLNFKSTMHESGSLVISGGRATYRGTGTINGQSGFKFVVVAIDGQWNGQSNPDRFRIKISTTAGVVVYDNQMGSAENTADATILGNNGTGGGSIVIHEVKSNGKKRIAVDLQEVTWNTSNEDLVKALDQMSKEWFEGSSVAMRWNIDAYDGMKPGFYQVVGEVISGNLSDLEDMVEIPVLVREKPRATDILATVKVIPSNVEVGQVFTKLITVDKADDIHTYQVSENDYFELVDDQLVWKSAAIPAELRVTVTSTDRAGQTIERELVFRKGAGNNGNFDIPAASSVSEVIVHPNPAREQFANVQVRLSQAAKVNLRVYDPQGRLVYQDEAYEENSFMRTLDLKGYSNGLYMILVQVDNQLITKRLIKE